MLSVKRAHFVKNDDGTVSLVLTNDEQEPTSHNVSGVVNFDEKDLIGLVDFLTGVEKQETLAIEE